jgi:exonuclease III
MMEMKTPRILTRGNGPLEPPQVHRRPLWLDLPKGMNLLRLFYSSLFPFSSFLARSCSRTIMYGRKAAYSVSPFSIVSLNINKRSLEREIPEIMREKPDIVCLQEVNRAQEVALDGKNTAALLPYTRLLGAMPSAVFIKGKTGMLFFNENIKVESYDLSDRVIKACIRVPSKVLVDRMGSNQLGIWSVYVPSVPKERRLFFEQDRMGLRKLDQSFPHIIMGDLNDYEFPAIDRTRREANPNLRNHDKIWEQDSRFWQRLISPIMEEVGLVDAFRFKYPDKIAFSRIHLVDGQVISATRIDHTLTSERLMDIVETVDYKTSSASDHKMIIVRLNLVYTDELVEEVGIGPWKLHHGAFTEEGFCMQCKIYAQQLLESFATCRPFKMSDWVDFKKRLRSHVRAASIRTGHTRRKPLNLTAQLLSQIDALDFSKGLDRDRATLLFQKLQKAKRLVVIDGRRTKGSNMTEGLILDIQSPKHKRPKPIRAALTSKRNARPPPENLTDKLRNVWEYYTGLFKTPEEAGTSSAMLEMLSLLSTTAVLSTEAVEHLKLPLSAGELSSALDACERCSAPGMDGLPFEFWHNIADIVTEPFAEACRDIDCPMDGAHEWPVLLGTIMHKKGLPQYLENYRLLSVLDTDLRIRAKAILNRMTTVSQDIISSQQTAFLEGRQLSDNVMAFMLALEEVRTTQSEAVIIALDQKKAYDRVKWTWLFCTLRQMGFPEGLVDSIKSLYTSPIVRISVNKFLTNAIQYQCRVLQGDPLSVLLYILTIQCLLDALKAAGIGITIQWEGKEATLYPMAHADNLIVFLACEAAYERLHKIIDLYCRASNAVMHPDKAVAYFSIGQTRRAEIGWHSKVKERAAQPEDDHKHLGCPFRIGGDAPTQTLERFIIQFKSHCLAWSFSGRPLIRRVEATNTYILSGIWHATQLCPLPDRYGDTYGDQVRRAVGWPIFKGKQNAIQFDHLCFPKRFGGLGLLHPEYMMQAMNGRSIARMISRSDPIAEFFKLSLLRVLETTEGGCFFKLFGPASWRANGIKMLDGPPFWRRIYNSMLGLGVSVSNDWDTYTDEELLSLPFDLPMLIGKEVSESFGKRVRPSLWPLRIFLLRDILSFEPRRRPKLQILSAERARTLLQRRYKEFPPPGGIPSFKGDGGAFRNAMSAVAFLRKQWNTEVWPKMDPKFKARLEKITALPESLKPMEHLGKSFNVKEIYNLILWQKLTLGGILCKDYKVRQGRMAGLKPQLLMPPWEEIRMEGETEEEKETARARIWTQTWQLLGWKPRPAHHHEPYWRLLHQRSLRARGASVSANKEPVLTNTENDSKDRFHTGTCANCGQKDTDAHAYLDCPDVRLIWNDSKAVLLSMLGSIATASGIDEVDCSVAEVVLGFPQLRRRLPKFARGRVILWHSSVIYAISACREWSLEHTAGEGNNTRFSFFGVQPRIQSEMRLVISGIFEKAKADGKGEKFSVEWLNSSEFVRKEGNRLSFMDGRRRSSEQRNADE